ncbi:putative membrane protein [Halomicronema hongdechloris C2206]|uniref:Membrane protein n=1 Tax=Halomicronema hongdechloris C2206 TaxID=1641165 RepID=A0A1Z3HK79_9CYAN|nr:TIGR00297 family protein [Halomicronema hongdechloris]ASC70724.1 putative membrane protein [Halomicronema hongdechloris C2206]
MDVSPALQPWLWGVAINTALLAIAWVAPKKLLTVAGYFHAWILGVLIWGCLGWAGYTVVMVYFLVGSAVTRIGAARKQAAGIAEGRSGRRGPENVWGSAAAGSLCALGILALQAQGNMAGGALLALGFVASFSTKLSDTTASEVGKAYGRRTFLVTTLKPVPPGSEGAVSLEGTLAGVVASVAIAFVGWAVGLIPASGIILCAIAALIATTCESLIGATLQETITWLTNELVNVINTLIGAIIAIALQWLLWQI